MPGSQVLGIDLGSTNVRVATIDESGWPYLLRTSTGDTKTPSAVLFEGEDVVVGDVARNSAEFAPESVVQRFLRHLGDPDWQFSHHGKLYYAEELSALVLRKAVDDAAVELNQLIQDVVISCPAWFDHRQREATITAGTIAGLNVLGLLHDDVAAAISYDNGKGTHEKLLVYDLGGTTFKVSRVGRRENTWTTLSTGDDRWPGGRDWDDKIVEYLADQFCATHGGVIAELFDDLKTRQQLLHNAERLKVTLSSSNRSSVGIIHNGKTVRAELTRSEFEEMTRPLLDQTINQTRDLLHRAGSYYSGTDEIDRILLVGGGTLMPQVASRLQQEFGVECFAQEPSEAVAKGAALYAQQLSEDAARVKPRSECRASSSQRDESHESTAESIDDSPQNLEAVKHVDESLETAKSSSVDINAYELLGLDTSVHDRQQIEQAIERKRREWTMSLNHPSRASEARRNLGLLPSIRKLLLDSNDEAERRSQAEASRTHNEAVTEKPNEEIKLGTAEVGAETSPSMKDSKFAEINRDNDKFDKALIGVTQNPAFQVDDKLSSETDKELSVELRFNRMEDFQPGIVAQQIEPLQKLLELREKLTDLKSKIGGNEKLESLLDDILKNADLAKSLAATSEKPVAPTAIQERIVPAREEVNRNGLSDRLPTAIGDHVHFAITAPPSMVPGGEYDLGFWAHLVEQRLEVMQRVQTEAAGEPIKLTTEGPVIVARGSSLSVQVVLSDFEVYPPVKRLLWDGEIGKATFAITVPAQAPFGSRNGFVLVHLDGFRIAEIVFRVRIAPETEAPTNLTTNERRHRRAFVSYASQDRDDVLARIQGLEKAAPDLKIFVDVARLKSGQNWQEQLREEILGSDVMYLFWSTAASRSTWVDREWRFGLETHGVRFIDPCPLDPPDVAPPPKELAEHLHFNDWVLAYLSKRNAEQRGQNQGRGQNEIPDWMK